MAEKADSGPWKKINPHVRVSKHAVDVTSESSVVSMAETVRQKEGRLDVLINNAGMTNKWAPIRDSDTEMWFKTWDLHIKGTYLMLKAFLPLLVETTKTRSVTGTVDVINTTTIAAHFAMPGGSAYHASKFALIRLSEFVVSEYEARGVNCLSLHPGGVPTGIATDLGPLVEAGEFYQYILILMERLR
jgi:NAD(P)-dependent dehydrogenase (short-subunit alcohol dehydrogenase family)